MPPELTPVDQSICEAINALFEIDVSWLDDIREVEPQAIVEFKENAAYLLELIKKRPHIVEAAKTISSAYGSNAKYSVPSLPSSYLETYISIREFNVFLESIVSSIYDQRSRELSEVKLESALDLFWEKERELLMLAGLNQGTTQVILERLKTYERQVITNFLTGQYIKPSRWERSSASAKNQLAGRIGVKSRTQYQRQTTLAALKDKIVGNAVIWANLIPLFYRVQMDWASTISTIAGATAAAIIPSQSRH